MADSKAWKCEQCGAVIGTVTKRGLRCDPLPQLVVYFEGMTGWVECECEHDNPWRFDKELLRQMQLTLDKHPVL